MLTEMSNKTLIQRTLAMEKEKTLEYQEPEFNIVRFSSQDAMCTSWEIPDTDIEF